MQVDQPTDTGILTAFFAHNTWANLKLLDFCEQLSDAQLDSTAIGGYGTIRETLTHIVRGEMSYVRRVNGRRPPHLHSADQFPGFTPLKDAARWTGDELLQIALAARQGSLVQERAEGMACEYTVASLIAQAITHATEHRTHIATIITQLGLEPPDMSVWNYIVEIGEYREYSDESQGQ